MKLHTICVYFHISFTVRSKQCCNIIIIMISVLVKSKHYPTIKKRYTLHVLPLAFILYLLSLFAGLTYASWFFLVIYAICFFNAIPLMVSFLSLIVPISRGIIHCLAKPYESLLYNWSQLNKLFTWTDLVKVSCTLDLKYAA